MNIEEHIQFCIDGADNDLDAAEKLFEEKFTKIKEHYKWVKSQIKFAKS
jgi:hypothetical protein